jgi:triacylglycerol esterase/lipase EstA (alpha/beta hydrolase family)
MGLVGCAPQAPAVAPAGGEGRVPVIIVHGFQLFCGSENEQTWARWIRAAEARGYGADEVEVLDYDTCQPTESAAALLASHVDAMLERTGASKVNIVAHSMGSLVARYCLRFGGCSGKVDKFASVAGANHGTVWANFCPIAVWSPGCSDMKPDGPFLAAMNAEDETWGEVDFVTMVSWCDLTIVPYTGVALAGATNIVTNECISHTQWRDSAEWSKWVFDWFDQSGAATGPAGVP